MTTADIVLSTIAAVKEFAAIAAEVDTEMELAVGRYVVDAKSIMGIFSLDLAEPVEVRIHSEGAEAEAILEKLQDYLLP